MFKAYHLLLILFFFLLLSGGLAQAQTATPTPTPTPVPTSAQTIIIVTPTPEPSPAPTGSIAEQFWQSYRSIIIPAIIAAFISLILFGVFIRSIAEATRDGIKRLYHRLFDRFASTRLFNRRFDRTYRQTLAESLQTLQGGNLVDRTIRLDKMYVPALLTEEMRPHIDKDGFGEKRYVTQDQMRRQQAQRQVGPWEAVRRFHRFVVLGEPGAGKTTYLYHLAYQCAHRQESAVDDYLPIFLRFRDHVAAISAEQNLEALFPKLLADYGFPNGERYVQQRLKEGRCLILLDGLDEVPSEDDHKIMIRRVQHFADRYVREAQPQGRNVLIVSSRKYNYEHRKPLDNFAKTEVMPFDTPTIERFVHNWFEGRLNHLGGELVAELKGNRRFLELARNPLLLLLIAHHYERERNLPRQRADLYRHCVRTRIALWNDKRGTHQGRFGETNKWRLLRSLALHITEEAQEGLLHHNKLQDWVESFAEPLVLPVDTSPADLLKEIVRTSGLLQEWAIDRYGFSHQTLQEFFAAEAIDRLGPVDGATRLVPHLHDSAWHEVVLLYAGLVDNAAPLLGRLLAQAEDAEPAFDLWLLAGQCLAEGAQQVPEGVRQMVAEKLMVLLRANLLTAKDRGEAIANCQQFAPDLLPHLAEPLLAADQAQALFLAAELLAPVADGVLKAQLSQQILPLSRSLDEKEKQAAIVALGRLGAGDGVAQAMETRLLDADPTTRAEAALALGRLQRADEATVVALKQLYEQDAEDEPRHAALQALLALGQAEAVGMKPIPASDFIMGEGEDEHSLYLPAYFMDRTPVTNAQYRRFMAAGGYANEAYWLEAITAKRWQNGAFLDPYNDNKPTTEPRFWQDAKWNGDEQPVIGISWYEALAFARWAGKRLPTEAEWEKGARGERGQLYPWGNRWQENVANTEEAKLEKTTPVGAYSPQGDSPYGLADMSGNVWEWCSTRYWNEAQKEYDYPYSPDDGREDLSGGDAVVRVSRGGSWYNDQELSQCAVRGRFNPHDRYHYFGFRCCATDSLSVSGS